MPRAPLLNDLRRVQVRASGEMMAALQNARSNVAAKARAMTPAQVGNEAFRRAFYGEVGNVYQLLDKELTGILKGATGETVNLTREAAIKRIMAVSNDQTVKGMALKFDPERMRRYMELIQPDNGPSLAAVFTQKMSEEDREKLRGAVIKSIRQGEFEGWTARERAKEIQKAWDTAAGDLNAARFVDRSGRAWDNARYLQMLVRTTQSRLSRESYIDTVVEHGDDLMRIVEHGDNCDICQAWDGVIISATGVNPKYPSYDDALDAGWGHPGCDGTLERVDETVDEDAIKEQGNADNPPAWDDLDAMAEYRERAGLPPPTENENEVSDFSEEAAKAYKKARAK